VEDLTAELGQKLKMAREKAGLTQREIALALEIKQPTYSQYEAGTRLPSLEIFAQLIKLFGISADFVLFGGGKNDEIRFDDETIKVFEEFQEFHQKNRQLFVDLVHLLRKHNAI
jgi:transcriptional regulator with XRE-family HTH domain